MAALARLLAFLAWGSCWALAQPGCQTQTSYSPIAAEYPDAVTGVMNGTFTLSLISRDTAGSWPPEGYEQLLDDAYRRGFEMWQEDYWPLLVKAVYIHDTRGPDDQWRNDHTLISFELPFVDALGDGKSPFRYTYTQFIQSGTPSYPNDVAEEYGVPFIIRSVYDPECDAYEWVDPDAPPDTPANPAKLRGIEIGGTTRDIEFAAARQLTREARPFTVEQLKAIVGQPRFGVASEGLLCGGTTVFWGEEVGFGELVETKGEVILSEGFESLDILRAGDGDWDRVYGIRAGTAFIDDDFVDCSTLAVAVGSEDLEEP